LRSGSEHGASQDLVVVASAVDAYDGAAIAVDQAVLESPGATAKTPRKIDAGPSEAPPTNVDTAVAATEGPADVPPSPDTAVAADPAPAVSGNADDNLTVASVQPAVAGQARPLDDIRTRSQILPIAGEGVPETPTLCQIAVEDASSVTLELIGGDFQDTRTLKLKLYPQAAQGKRAAWKVRQEADTGFDRMQDVGEFQLKDQQLGFVWSKNADKGKLPFCKLKITTGSDSEVCSLFAPVRSAALGVNFNNRVQKLTSFVPPGVQIPPVESLKLELTMEGWPEHQQEGDLLVLNKTIKLSFEDAEAIRDALRILLTLKVESGQLGVYAAYFTDVPRSATQRTKKVEDIRFEAKPLSHKDLEKLAKDLAKETASYQSELDAMDDSLKKLQATQDKLDSQSARGSNQAIAAEQLIVERRMEQLTEKQAVMEEFRNFYADADAAATALKELCDKIESDARIHFRLIRPFNGGEAVIASSVNAVP